MALVLRSSCLLNVVLQIILNYTEKHISKLQESSALHPLLGASSWLEPIGFFLTCAALWMASLKCSPHHHTILWEWIYTSMKSREKVKWRDASWCALTQARPYYDDKKVAELAMRSVFIPPRRSQLNFRSTQGKA